MTLFLIVLALSATAVFSLDTTKTLTSQLHEFQLNNSAGVMAALDMLPKECSKNGKKYKADESFEIGNLRYKCQKYGVYTIEGCKRKDGTEMKLGESVVVDNVKHQCLGVGSSVYYKETTCGILGQPECDNIPLPKGFEEAMKKNGEKHETSGKSSVDGVNLPKGWTLVDRGRKAITGTNASVVTHILMFNPTQTRVKRDGFKGPGVGSVVGVESMSADQIGKPLSSKGTSSSSHSSSSSGMSSPSSKVIGTQTVGATLHTLKSGDKHDTDLVDLNQRHDQKMEGSDKMKAGSVRGSKSNVDWKGRKVIVNGKTIGAGEGTFTFGNKPTL
uniref:Pectate lyase n=1 Tax=Caenorhabditis tropicalis TaxID=1561998 RepID=A0A1I7U2Q1_9PELO